MTHKKEKEEASGFKVVDHRHFKPDGTELEGGAQEGVETKEPPPLSEKGPPEEGTEVNFASFILSLAGSVQMSLGISPNPFTGKMEKDLNQAKQTIDLLGILSEKTKGNLSPEESQLLEVILADLRLRFVEEKSKK